MKQLVWSTEKAVCNRVILSTHSDRFFEFMIHSSSHKKKRSDRNSKNIKNWPQLVYRSSCGLETSMVAISHFLLLNKKACVCINVFSMLQLAINPLSAGEMWNGNNLQAKLSERFNDVEKHAVNNSMAVNKKCSAKWKLDQAIESIFHAYIHFIINFLLVCVCVRARASGKAFT